MKVVSLFIILLGTGNLFANSVVNLTLPEAEKRALKSSDDLKIHVSDLRVLKSKIKEVKGSLYPHVSGKIDWQSNVKRPVMNIAIPPLAPGMSAINMEYELQKKYESNLTLSASQVIWMFGRVGHGIKVARSAYTAGKMSYNAMKREVIYNSKLAYYGVLFTGESKHIFNRSYKNAIKNRRIFKSRTSGGRSSKKNILKMEADVAARLPKVKQATIQHNLAEKYLKLLLDIHDEAKINLLDDFNRQFYTINNPGQLTESLVKNDPSLKMLQQITKMNHSLIKLKKADYYPKIAAFSYWNYGGAGNDPTVGSDNLQHSAAVGIKIDIPIWSGTETYYRYRQAVFQKTKARIQYNKVKKALIMDLKNAIFEHNGLIDSYMAELEAVKLAKKTFLLSQKRFRTGNATITELNDMELMLSGQRLQVASTIYKINILKAKIDKLSKDRSEREKIR